MDLIHLWRDMDVDHQNIRKEINLIKWMIGLNIALSLASLIKLLL